MLCLIVYSEACLKKPLNKRHKIVCFIKTDFRIMQVKSIAECYFRSAFSTHLSKRPLLCISLSGHYRQILLHSPTIGNRIK